MGGILTVEPGRLEGDKGPVESNILGSADVRFGSKPAFDPAVGGRPVRS